MLQILRNQRGNIAVAMALAVVGIMSGITMSILAYKDTVDTRYDFDGIQTLHLLRSETVRAQMVAQLLDYTGNGFTLPSRYATVSGSHTKTMYRMRTKTEKQAIATGGGLYYTQGYMIKSLIDTNRGGGSGTVFGKNMSMVAKYGEKGIRRNSFAGYFWFTNTDESTNGTNVYFYGEDVVYGKVHSNSDIWIKRTTGPNDGWPTFHGPVYTAGVIQSFSGTPPYLQVFRAGYWEHVAELEFDPTASQIRAHGMPVGETAYDPNRIIFVEVTGASYNSWRGLIINSGADTADVWTQYPPRAGAYQFRNRWTKYDTLWSTGPSGPCSGHSNMVYSKLWLKGTFTGSQTWCAADTIYLNDNILLTGTQKGSCPDGTVTGSTLNRNDFVGIVSEKSILIQYGYKDPEDSTRYKPNCDGDAEGIWIYGALCALGEGNGNTHADGVFTFEYQHPHPSVPAVRLGTNPYVWDKIDLHRRRYPQNTTARWPGNIDYPWYNPLWPEGCPYLERGTIHIWGSIAQRRNGYQHRELTDADFPNPGQIWNTQFDMCGGPAGNTVFDSVLGTTFQPVNAPNSSGGGVGYKRDFHYDNRFNTNSPPDYPSLNTGNWLDKYGLLTRYFRKPPRNLTELE